MKRSYIKHKPYSVCRICRCKTKPGKGICDKDRRALKAKIKAVRARMRVRETKPSYVAGWRKNRQEAKRDKCEVCKAPTRKPHVDHIVPYVLSSRHGGNPDDPRNLISLDAGCHGRKKRAEKHIIHGDVIGYLQEINRLGWDMKRVSAALELYGFRGME